MSTSSGREDRKPQEGNDQTGYIQCGQPFSVYEVCEDGCNHGNEAYHDGCQGGGYQKQTEALSYEVAEWLQEGDQEEEGPVFPGYFFTLFCHHGIEGEKNGRDNQPEQQCAERPVVFENDLGPDESDTPEEHGSQGSDIHFQLSIGILHLYLSGFWDIRSRMASHSIP